MYLNLGDIWVFPVLVHHCSWCLIQDYLKHLQINGENVLKLCFQSQIKLLNPEFISAVHFQCGRFYELFFWGVLYINMMGYI